MYDSFFLCLQIIFSCEWLFWWSFASSYPLTWSSSKLMIFSPENLSIGALNLHLRAVQTIWSTMDSDFDNLVLYQIKMLLWYYEDEGKGGKKADKSIIIINITGPSE